jgi:polyhydroxybutyrate depolymerase
MKVYKPALLALALLLGGSIAHAQGPRRMTWTVDGTEREALVFLPAGGAANSPVVFVWHGHGGNMRGAANGFHIQRIWREAVVVYPQGLPSASKIDPQGVRPGWQRQPGELGDRDLKFFDAMLDTLRQRFRVNAERVFVVGFSNGAFFSYVLWAERPAALSGIGACAGRVWEGAHLREPKPLVQVAGERDPLVKLADQKKIVEMARRLNGANGGGQSCGERCTLYPSSKGAPVELMIYPGGHVCPPGAVELMVDFFKTQTH